MATSDPTHSAISSTPALNLNQGADMQAAFQVAADKAKASTQAKAVETEGKAVSDPAPSHSLQQSPKLTHEMPGPLGAIVRQTEARQNYAEANKARAAKHIVDDKRTNDLVSSKDVNNEGKLDALQYKGPLSKEMNKVVIAQDKSRDR